MHSVILPAYKSHLESPNKGVIYVLLIIGIIASGAILSNVLIMEWKREPNVSIKQSVSVQPNLEKNMQNCTYYVIEISFDVSGTERVDFKNPLITLYADNASKGIHNETVITDVTFTISRQTHTYKTIFLFHPTAGLIKAEECVSLHFSGNLEITIIYYRYGIQREETVPVSFDLGEVKVCRS